jgi:hypothetical protein
VHDFDQGITPYPEGLFWTVPLQAPDGVTVNFGAGRAQMVAADLPTFDYFNIPNGLFHFAEPVPAICSFDISWSGSAGAASRTPVDAPEGSTGEAITCDATMVWSASIPSTGWHFESNPQGTSTVFAVLGKVANGVFA